MSYIVFNETVGHHKSYIDQYESKMQRDIDTTRNYLQVSDEVGSAECLIVLGSRDERGASYAAELASAHKYGSIVIPGGAAHHNDLLATNWPEATEAEHFYAVICASGRQQSVLLEKKAIKYG